MELYHGVVKEYPNYRLEIYNDIVDNLCIKGYN